MAASSPNIPAVKTARACEEDALANASSSSCCNLAARAASPSVSGSARPRNAAAATFTTATSAPVKDSLRRVAACLLEDCPNLALPTVRWCLTDKPVLEA
eukprot:CAMPEP_0115355514 /NCGR_PEP_ID=MMETSP0270-20121206/99141_1 /TAXON_ID=71861 /ORGANISM="Scrippsiella trochoidea, Strain CCMP3099" /LENGTH=99 /DNA_ID=CAMNT_0002777881 /DNA_START=227 /DNA_END=527 /DNA_ORIENTATION=+